MIQSGLLTTLAQPTPPLRLKEAVQRVRQSHPLLIAAKRRIAMFEGELSEAGLKPNPSLTISGENFPLTPSENGFSARRTIDWFAYFSQTIERGDKRAWRLLAAERAVELAQMESEALERQLVYEVKVAYQQAAIARERIELLRENLNQLTQLVKLNEVRVNAGYTAEGDLIKARLEAQRTDYLFHKAGLEYERAKIALQKSMGETNFETDVELTERLTYHPVTVNAMALQQAALRRASFQVLTAKLEKARALLRLEEARAKPDVTASLGYKRNGADNTLYGALHIPLAIYSQNRGLIARAQAEVEMVEAELRYERAVIMAEVTAARRAVEMNEKQVEILRAEFLRNADESQQVSLAAYREGATDLLHVIEAQRTRTQAQELYFQALAEYQLAVHELERAAGIEQIPSRDLIKGKINDG